MEVGQDHRVLGRYLEAGYRYIAVSAPPGPRWTRWDLDTALPWMRRGFQLAGPGVGFHLLEATGWALLAALPWYSADVQGWAEAVSRERLMWFEQEPGWFRQVPIAKSDGRRLLAECGVDPGLMSGYDRRAVLAGMAVQAWHAAEAWLAEQLSPVTITGVDQAGPRLYLASPGDVHLAHRGLSRLAVSHAGQASSTTLPAPAPDGLPAVVAALTANQRAWLRDGLDFLERHRIELVAGDFACRGFPEGRPAATVLGALLLERHNQLPFDYGQQRYLTHRAWQLGARLAAGIGAAAAAPYMRAWDAIVAAGGSRAVRRLLDTADAIDAPGPT